MALSEHTLAMQPTGHNSHPRSQIPTGLISRFQLTGLTSSAYAFLQLPAIIVNSCCAYCFASAFFVLLSTGCFLIISFSGSNSPTRLRSFSNWTSAFACPVRSI